MDAFFLPGGQMLLLRVVHACGFTRTDLCAVGAGEDGSVGENTCRTRF